MKDTTDVISPKQSSPGNDSSGLTGQQVALMIDKTGVTRVTKILVFAAALGYLFDAFDNTIVGYLMPLISKDFAMSPAVKGIILSLALWGGVVGMMFWGPVSEAKGRRFGFQGTVLSFSFFTGFASLAWSWTVLGFTRFVAGAGLSGFYPVDLAMVSEMTPTRLRGRLTSSVAIMYPVGVIVAGLVTGAVAQKIGWRYTFLIGALPAVCAYMIRRSVPESPRWLASRGRTDEALAALKAMGVTQQTIDEVRNSGTKGLEAAEVDKGHLSDKFKELFSRRWAKSNLVAWTLWISGNFAAWGVTLWLPTLLMEVYHVTFLKSALYTMATYVFSLCGRCTGVFLIDKFGRKPLIGSAFAVAGLACIGFGFIKIPVLLIAFIGIMKFCDGQANVGVMGYIPELFPTRLRVMGNAYAGSASRVTSALAPIMVGVLMGMNHYVAIWIIFASVYWIGAIILTLFGPETKGKSLEEITKSA